MHYIDFRKKDHVYAGPTFEIAFCLFRGSSRLIHQEIVHSLLESAETLAWDGNLQPPPTATDFGNAQ
jgi:hypothetical protein